MIFKFWWNDFLDRFWKKIFLWCVVAVHNPDHRTTILALEIWITSFQAVVSQWHHGCILEGLFCDFVLNRLKLLLVLVNFFHLIWWWNGDNPGCSVLAGLLEYGVVLILTGGWAGVYQPLSHPHTILRQIHRVLVVSVQLWQAIICDAVLQRIHQPQLLFSLHGALRYGVEEWTGVWVLHFFFINFKAVFVVDAFGLVKELLVVAPKLINIVFGIVERVLLHMKIVSMMLPEHVLQWNLLLHFWPANGCMPFFVGL